MNKRTSEDEVREYLARENARNACRDQRTADVATRVALYEYNRAPVPADLLMNHIRINRS
jgi:hypothetical protein